MCAHSQIQFILLSNLLYKVADLIRFTACLIQPNIVLQLLSSKPICSNPFGLTQHTNCPTWPTTRHVWPDPNIIVWPHKSCTRSCWKTADVTVQTRTVMPSTGLTSTSFSGWNASNCKLVTFYTLFRIVCRMACHHSKTVNDCNFTDRFYTWH